MTNTTTQKSEYKTRISKEIQRHIHLSLDKLTDELVELIHTQANEEGTTERAEIDKISDDTQEHILTWLNGDLPQKYYDFK